MGESPIQRRSPGFALVGVADAGLSSIGNFAITFIAANYLPLPEFGALSIVYLSALLLTGVSKVLLIDPFVLIHSASDSDVRRVVARQAVGTAVACSLLFGVITGGILAALQQFDTLGIALLAGVVVLPGLVLQDSFRWVSYALGMPYAALASSAVWTGTLALGLTIIVAASLHSMALMLFLWGVTAFLGALAGMVTLGLVPSLGALLKWFKESNKIGQKTLVDYVMTQLVGQGGPLIVGVLAGASALGLMRVAQLPLAPVPVVITGLISYLQPEMIRRVSRIEQVDARRLAGVVSLSVSILVVLISVLVLYLPNSVISALAGPNWESSKFLLPAGAAVLIGSAISAGYGPYLRATGDLNFQVVSKTVVSLATVIAVIVLTVWKGVLFGSLGLAGGSIVLGITAMVRSHRWLRSAERQDG